MLSLKIMLIFNVHTVLVSFNTLYFFRNSLLLRRVTAKNVLGKKDPKKSLIFRTKKVLWQKSPSIKKSPEIKSYKNSRLSYLGLFFMFTSIPKKGAIDIKNIRMAIFKVQIHRKVFFLLKRFKLDLIFTRCIVLYFSFFGYIFIRTIFPVIFFPETLLAAPKL